MTEPSLANAGRSLATVSSVVPKRGNSSVSTTVSPLRPLIVTGTISSLKRPALIAASALFCERDRERVLLLARDLILLGDVLGGVAHVVAVERVPQAVLDHGVDELEIAHLLAGAQVGGVRRLAHALLAAGDHDPAVALPDRLKAERHRAQARAAQLVDAPGRHLDRDAGVDRGLARRVLALAGGQDLAHHHLGHLGRLDPAALERGADRDLAEIVRRHARERAVEAADRRPRGTGNDDLGHAYLP